MEEIDTMADDKDMYTVKEAAGRLGIGASAVYEMVAAGRIPSVRISRGSIRIPVRAFEDWIESETSQTATR